MRARGLVSSVVVVLCVLAGSLVLCGGVAWAKFVHPPVGTFGPEGPGTPASFGGVQSIAVDQVSGAVYVYDIGANAIDKFNAAGEPAEFSATHADAIPGVGHGIAAEQQVAVDNSGGASTGDIYVANGGSGVAIYASDGTPLGELNSGVQSSGGPWSPYVCGVAVDPSGHVYVGLASNGFNRYAPGPLEDHATNADYTSHLSSGPRGEVCNVAVDSQESLYADTFESGPVTKYAGFLPGGVRLDGRGSTLAVDPSNDDVYVDEVNQISQFSSTGTALSTIAGLSGSYGVAVNGASGSVYAADGGGGRVDVFGASVVVPDVTTGVASNLHLTSAKIAGAVNPDGVPVGSCDFEYGTSSEYGATVACAPSPGSGTGPVQVSAELSGLQQHTTYHFRLVAGNANGENQGQDQTFATPEFPSIDEQIVEGVGTTAATLAGKINPNGSDTTYRFEYGPGASYGTSIPVPAADIGAGSSDRSVHKLVSGLSPGATYHYRLVASNAAGEVHGSDRSFKTFATPAAGADTCPNAQLRAQQGAAFLPDCRAYELVSPPQKNGGDVAVNSRRTRAAQELAPGEPMAVSFESLGAFADVRGTVIAGEYMSLRDGSPGTQGWSTHAITPPQEPMAYTAAAAFDEAMYWGDLSPDLSTGVFGAWSALTQAPNVEHIPNLYLRGDLRAAGAGSYQLLSDCLSPPAGPCESPLKLNLAPAIPAAQRPFFAGASSDFGHVVFESVRRLTLGATAVETGSPPHVNVYDWDHGTLRLASILPDGTSAPSAVVGSGAGNDGRAIDDARIQHAVSSDGRRIVFTQLGGATFEYHVGNVFQRVDDGQPDASTIQINASERTDCNVERHEAEPGFVCTGAAEPDPARPLPATYEDASTDGSRVFFLSEEKLTDDAAAEGSGHLYLYMYKVDAPSGHHLTLLNGSQTGEGFISKITNPTGGLIGLGSDGRYVYFWEEGQLVAGGPPLGVGNPGIYVWHDDGTPGRSLRYIGAVKMGEGEPGAEQVVAPAGDLGGPGHNPVRVTPDGLHLLFRSASGEGLTGYDQKSCNLGGVSPGCYELYLYSAVSGKLVCVSCNPTGAPATHPSFDIAKTGETGAATLGNHMNHALSDDGRYVFFNTAEALSPQDVNGRVDAYEYDASSGEIHLLSSGTGAADSYFLDASGDGRDVFIVTRDRLVGWDVDRGYDLYDVRVDGGFPGPPAPGAVCAGEACQAPPTGAPAAGLGALSSLSASGAGNVGAQSSGGVVKPRRAAPCPRGRVRVRVRGKSRCVVRHRKRPVRAKKGSVRRVSGNRVGR